MIITRSFYTNESPITNYRNFVLDNTFELRKSRWSAVFMEVTSNWSQFRTAYRMWLQVPGWAKK